MQSKHSLSLASDSGHPLSFVFLRLCRLHSSRSFQPCCRLAPALCASPFWALSGKKSIPTTHFSPFIANLQTPVWQISRRNPEVPDIIPPFCGLSARSMREIWLVCLDCGIEIVRAGRAIFDHRFDFLRSTLVPRFVEKNFYWAICQISKFDTQWIKCETQKIELRRKVNLTIILDLHVVVMDHRVLHFDNSMTGVE